MRLLFDEQLSEELVTAVRDLFPDSLHVRLLGKGGAADPIIWEVDGIDGPTCAGARLSANVRPRNGLGLDGDSRTMGL